MVRLLKQKEVAMVKPKENPTVSVDWKKVVVSAVAVGAALLAGFFTKKVGEKFLGPKDALPPAE
jgi:hypothetical protein